ncbi:MAG: hypothetical protein MUF83_02420 [Acidimicrobiales bacterium]|nr:hypothetical protein [Acidimicrobiales bacterium]
MIAFRSPPADVDEVLRDLPESHVVAARQTLRFVAGPNGAFLVADEQDTEGHKADRLLALASRIRAVLAEHLPLVPFVSPIVVSPVWSPVWVVTEAPTTVVPLDLLRRILVEGPTVVSDSTLDVLARLVVDGSLDDWRAVTDHDDKMGRWSPEQMTSEAC